MRCVPSRTTIESARSLRRKLRARTPLNEGGRWNPGSGKEAAKVHGGRRTDKSALVLSSRSNKPERGIWEKNAPGSVPRLFSSGRTYSTASCGVTSGRKLGRDLAMKTLRWVWVQSGRSDDEHEHSAG